MPEKVATPDPLTLEVPRVVLVVVSFRVTVPLPGFGDTEAVKETVLPGDAVKEGLGEPALSVVTVAVFAPVTTKVRLQDPITVGLSSSP